MVTKDQLQADLKEAMRSGDEVRKRTLRMILAAIKLAEVEKRRPLEPRELLEVLQKEAKVRREELENAKKADRQDLINAAEAELALIQSYLPQAMDEAEIRQLAEAVIQEVGAQGPQDMGRVMKEMMSRVAGRAEGRQVSEVVRRLLSGG